MLRLSAVGKFTDNTNLGEAADTLEAGAAVQTDLVGWRNGLTMSLRTSTKASGTSLDSCSAGGWLAREQRLGKIWGFQQTAS